MGRSLRVFVGDTPVCLVERSVHNWTRLELTRFSGDRNQASLRAVRPRADEVIE